MGKEGKGLFIAATHGDEGFSLNVLKKLENIYPKEKYNYDWIIANKMALKKGRRFMEADLNRCSPGFLNSSIYEERRAAEISKLSEQYTFAIDLHGTVSNSGIVTIIPNPTLANLFLAATVPVNRNVIWYSSPDGSIPSKGSLTQFTQCPGIEIECGHKDSEETKLSLEEVLGVFLETYNNFNIKYFFKKLSNKEFYNVYGKQPEDGKTYIDFELVKIGEEEFYPFLSNQYPGIACYKMQKVNLAKTFLFAD